MTEKRKFIGSTPISKEPESKYKLILGEGVVKTKHIADNSVTADKIKDGAVTPEKVSEDFKSGYIYPYIQSFDSKYSTITKELYSMVKSLQVGGIALSGQLGDREDIGIHQKTLTELFGKILDELSEITGKTYVSFNLSVTPLTTYSESSVTLEITADCTDSFSDFDSIQIYIDDILVSESSNTTTYTISREVSESCTVKAVAVIIGKTLTKEINIIKEIPFFMGSGSVYTDVINENCRKELEGTLEGNYNVTIAANGDYMFIIIPSSVKDQFRRADMNGYEIPFNMTEYSDYVVYKSSNTYKAGIYNIDISINS